MFEFLLRQWLVEQRWAYRSGFSEERARGRRQSLARWLKDTLLSLGPTFIKIGQQFSTRVDLLSSEIVTELETLQDTVPPFDAASARCIVEQDLGAPLEQLFDNFALEPIAAASLGQVHLATLDGEQVVVKVQRPGLRNLFEVDMRNVKLLARFAQRIEGAVFKQQSSAKDWVSIFEECERVLYQEIDYALEGRNADEFGCNFANSDWIKVPRVFWSRTSTRVLCMEYVPGIKISKSRELELAGLHTGRLARLTVEAYLQQLLQHNLFQTNPHPGNIAVDCEGRIIFYDFGMVGRIDSKIRKGLLDLFYGVYEKSTDQCLDALVRMGVLVDSGDQTAVRRTAEYFLDTFEQRLNAQDAERQKSGSDFADVGKGTAKEDLEAQRDDIVATLGEDLLSVAKDQPFRFPATFTFVARAFSMLDGLGKSLDRRFDIAEISRPYARELLLEAQRVTLPPQVVSKQRQLRKAIDQRLRTIVNVFKAPNSIQEMATFLNKVERADAKPRVRALEVERALEKNQVLMELMLSLLGCCTAMNFGLLLVMSGSGKVASKMAFHGAAAFGVIALLKLRRWGRKNQETILLNTTGI
jgi:predicted unusual protein kinase regulating ubiquinone biosynthesis (AarF/ABC1/UbiB family)